MNGESLSVRKEKRDVNYWVNGYIFGEKSQKQLGFKKRNEDIVRTENKK